MGSGRIGQAFEVVAAFEHRNHAAVGAWVGDVHELFRYPVEIGLDQLQVGERIAPVRVEAGRDDDEIGAKFFSRGRITDLERLAEMAGRRRRRAAAR